MYSSMKPKGSEHGIDAVLELLHITMCGGAKYSVCAGLKPKNENLLCFLFCLALSKNMQSPLLIKDFSNSKSPGWEMLSCLYMGILLYVLLRLLHCCNVGYIVLLLAVK